MTELEIKPLDEKDLTVLHKWIEEEGRSKAPLSDPIDWFRIYPNDFMGAYSTDGKLLCNIFSHSLDKDTVLVEVFIAAPEVRGKGIGSKLLQKVLKDNHDRNTVLIAVPSMDPFYEKRGFTAVGIMFYIQGMKPLVTAKPNLDLDPDFLVGDFHMQGALVDSVVKYDLSVHGKDRAKMLQFFLKKDNYVCCYVSSKLNNEVVGFIVIRKATKSYAIVAFCAESFSIAEQLLISAVNKCTDPNLDFIGAFPSLNKADVTKLYEKFFYMESPALEETCFSTRSTIDKGISWTKIYSSVEMIQIGFM